MTLLPTILLVLGGVGLAYLGLALWIERVTRPDRHKDGGLSEGNVR